MITWKVNQPRLVRNILRIYSRWFSDTNWQSFSFSNGGSFLHSHHSSFYRARYLVVGTNIYFNIASKSCEILHKSVSAKVINFSGLERKP